MEMYGVTVHSSSCSPTYIMEVDPPTKLVERKPRFEVKKVSKVLGDTDGSGML